MVIAPEPMITNVRSWRQIVRTNVSNKVLKFLIDAHCACVIYDHICAFLYSTHFKAPGLMRMPLNGKQLQHCYSVHQLLRCTCTWTLYWFNYSWVVKCFFGAFTFFNLPYLGFFRTFCCNFLNIHPICMQFGPKRSATLCAFENINHVDSQLYYVYSWAISREYFLGKVPHFRGHFDHDRDIFSADNSSEKCAACPDIYFATKISTLAVLVIELLSKTRKKRWYRGPSFCRLLFKLLSPWLMAVGP